MLTVKVIYSDVMNMARLFDGRLCFKNDPENNQGFIVLYVLIKAKVIPNVTFC